MGLPRERRVDTSRRLLNGLAPRARTARVYRQLAGALSDGETGSARRRQTSRRDGPNKRATLTIYDTGDGNPPLVLTQIPQDGGEGESPESPGMAHRRGSCCDATGSACGASAGRGTVTMPQSFACTSPVSENRWPPFGMMREQVRSGTCRSQDRRLHPSRPALPSGAAGPDVGHAAPRRFRLAAANSATWSGPTTGRARRSARSPTGRRA